ncbi:MAG: hypothetical protein PHR87_12080 [Sulfurospirillaceae bacterium]|nr:hypothetical protein [Sulfurospirillaceae bacterium]
MKRGSFVMILLLMFWGCSSKTLVHSEHEKLLDFGMANSKKVEILGENNAKAYFTITYLNPMKDTLINPQESEKFIVGTYVATGNEKEQSIKLSNFKVNGSSANVNVTKLEKDAPLLSLISSANPWTEYLLIEAPYTKKHKMKLSFENDHSVKVSADFQKDF